MALDLPPASGTIEQVLDWARERFPEVVWELAEAAVEVVRRVVTQVARLAQDWPEALRRIRSIELADLPADIAASSSALGEIRLSRALMRDPLEARRISAGAERRGYEPDYDLFLVREVLDLLGGEIIEYVPPEPDVPGRVY